MFYFAHASWFPGVAGIAIPLICSSVSSYAHDAPSGWSYPFSCCSTNDCRQVSGTDVKERPEGYVIAGTGELLSYADTRLKDSPDGEYHWCSVAGQQDSRTICLFVPPRSF